MPIQTGTLASSAGDLLLTPALALTISLVPPTSSIREILCMRKHALGAETSSGVGFQRFSSHELSAERTVLTRQAGRKVCFLRGVEWPVLGRAVQGRRGIHIALSTAPGL